MNNIGIWLVVGSLIGIVLAIFHYTAGYNKDLKNQNFPYKFLEFWRHLINYLIAVGIIFYFVEVRWFHLKLDGIFSVSDFVLGLIFIMSILGWLPYFIKNITEGINVIMSKWLK